MADSLKEAEIFSVTGTTKDGAPFAAAGFCAAGTTKHWEDAVSRFSNVPVKSSSIYTVDLNLAMCLANYQGSSLFLAAVCCDTGSDFGTDERTGGVIGEPGIDDESADSVVSWTNKGFPGVAVPGGPGIYAGENEDPDALIRASEELSKILPDPSEEGISEAIKKAGISGPVLAVFDGSGKGAHGAVYARDGAGKVLCEILPD